MSEITWLASFPKSGNTWTRIFLTNYLRGAGQAADINALGIPNFSDRSWWDKALGWSSSDFTEEAIFNARLDVQETIARTEKAPIFKTHDSFLDCISKKPLFSPVATRGAIYVVRNPLDVVLSYSSKVK